MLLPDIAFALCLGAGIYLTAMGQLQGAELIAFFAMATVLRWPMESIGFLFSFLLDARTATDRLFEAFDEENTIVDPANPVSIERPQGELVFEGAHFRYQDAAPRERDLLDGIDLVLRPGETMALVGLTGSGKTTLTTLPTRLYDVTGGRVTLHGVDVRDLTLKELRRHIGMAFEDATLFSQSVRDNVLLGREDLVPGSDEAERVLREALGVAQAGFVDELPDGVDTIIGEEGLSLSGGQRRAARARARRRRPARRARARRPAVGARRRYRGPRRRCPPPGAVRDDRARRGAPSLHRHARRSRRVAGVRPRDGGRHAFRAAAHQPRLRHVISSLEVEEARMQAARQAQEPIGEVTL